MKTNPFIRLMRFDKPVGALLLLYPTLIALFVVSNGTPSLLNLIVFVLGVMVTRAAGCVINDIADRNIDDKVARTAKRPIAAGEISVGTALGVFGVLALAGILLLIGFLPKATYPWAALCVIFMSLYPLAKRYVKIPQAVLGLAFSMPIPMVYATYGYNPLINIDAWLIFAANMFWTVAYDTQYAIADMDDDLKIGTVNSSAITFGRHVNKIVFALQVIYLAILAVLGFVNYFSSLFYVCLGINFAIFVYQYFSVNTLDGATGLKAFNQNILVGTITSIAIILGLIGSQTYKLESLESDYYVLQVQYQKLQEQVNKPQLTPQPVTVPANNPTTPESTPPASPSNEPTQTPARPATPTTPSSEPSNVPADKPQDQPTTPETQPNENPQEQPTNPENQPAENPNSSPTNNPTNTPQK
ncbi:4-hydroxybenzoate octaprenyltransferase [Psittacicella hinzii]|uniref:4-hydroxybenzoate octaprenyltransferase n=1 Tax=Psittacicella hinzii TaxID=2028575 RepID=A0A3A1YCI7_9GAMM|nr:UbiA family prenyltransferase [Psittacicella hinzii]RIY35086.1 4-hydroxybenzoate polyprenyltransferase [Psittacicella hinzii]